MSDKDERLIAEAERMTSKAQILELGSAELLKGFYQCASGHDAVVDALIEAKSLRDQAHGMQPQKGKR